MLEVRKVKAVELESALEKLFNYPGEGQSVRQQVDSFKQMANRENYDLTRQFVVIEDEEVIYSCCYLPGAAGSATVLSSNPKDLEPAQQIKAVQALSQLRIWAEHEGADFQQMYLETDDKARRDIALSCGFKYLTDLKYMYRMNDVGDASVDGPELRWVRYNEENEELFKAVMERSYIDSADCPELEESRDMDQTIEGHKAAGKFMPELWQIAYCGGEAVGVLLLSALSDGQAVELTYIGVAPEMRGKGFGKVMVAEAIRIANRMGCYMTVAADKRNVAALGLYGKMGFGKLFDRSIVYYSGKSSE